MRLLCKVERLNPIRSFKGRGTEYFVQRLESAPHLVCASAGNFGQGLAYAARKRGLPVTIFAAESANPLKIGLELTRWSEPLDAVVVPLGNGALLAGIGSWLRAHAPETEVIGVSAAGAPAMAESWRAGRPIETAAVDTIADGIAVRVPVPEALEDLRGVVDDVVVVSDDAIIRAMRLQHAELGLVIEPAGAAGVAAVWADRDRFAEWLVATPLCGWNLTGAQVAHWFYGEE